MKYFILSFPRFGNKAKCGVDRCYETHNASGIRLKVGNGSVLMGMEYINTTYTGFLCLERKKKKEKKIKKKNIILLIDIYYIKNKNPFVN